MRGRAESPTQVKLSLFFFFPPPCSYQLHIHLYQRAVGAFYFFLDGFFGFKKENQGAMQVGIISLYCITLIYNAFTLHLHLPL